MIYMINFLTQIRIGFYLVARKGDKEEGRGPLTKGWAGEILPSPLALAILTSRCGSIHT